MTIPLDKKEKHILQFIHDEGYAKKRAIADYLDEVGLTGVSEPNVQRILGNLNKREIISHKQLGHKLHVYFVANRGLQMIGKDKKGINDYKKQLSLIQKNHLEHYFLVRSLEKSIQKSIKNAEYLFESMNEFNTDGRLNLKEFRIKADGEIRFLKNGNERLSLLVEMDTGVESIAKQINLKFQNYAKYLESQQMENSHATHPVYMLFVTPLNRIDTILLKLGKLEVIQRILFLPIEHLQQFPLDEKFVDELNEKRLISEIRNKIKKNKHQISKENSSIQVIQKGKKWIIEDSEHQVKYTIKYVKKGSPLVVTEIKNLFSSDVLYDSHKKKHSLLSIINERETLLTFHNALQKAAKSYIDYQIISKTRYSSHRDAFFPKAIQVSSRTITWQPHGYMRIKKIHPNKSTKDVLFVLVLSLLNITGSIEEELIAYDIFLKKRHYIEYVVKLPVSYGLLIIAKNQEQRKKVFDALGKFKVAKRTRVILLENCLAEKILNAPVWCTDCGEHISLFPQEQKKRRAPTSS